MAVFLNSVLEGIILNLETEYKVFEVFDKNDANVVLNDAQEEDFPIAFFSISNQGNYQLTNYRKTYPVYDVAVWFLNLYEEDNKGELKSNYEALRLDAMEFVQRFQRSEAYARVPSNGTLTANRTEFDADLDLLASTLQIDFTASIDIQEDTSRVCAQGNVSSFTVNDDDLSNVLLDASLSSFRGNSLGAISGIHEWTFTLDTTTVVISGEATTSITSEDVTLLESVGMFNTSGDYNNIVFEKNPTIDPQLIGGINISHRYDFRGNGGFSIPTTGNVRGREIFTFNTLWNTTLDGPFAPSIVGGTNSVWIFGTDQVTGDNPNYTGSFLDGTLNAVSFITDDYNIITSINVSDKKLVDGIDFTLFTGMPVIILQDFIPNAFNNQIDELILPENGVNEFSFYFGLITAFEAIVTGTLRLAISNTLQTILLLDGSDVDNNFIQQNTALLSYENRGVNSGGFTAFSSPLFTSIQITSGSPSGGAIDFRALLTIFELGNYVIDGNWLLFRFGESATTQSDLDNAWIEIDRVAIPTVGSPVIDGSRPTALPSSLSQGARDNLVLNGYSLNE